MHRLPVYDAAVIAPARIGPWPLLLAATAVAQEPLWEDFRGPSRQGHTGATLPLHWSEERNVRWKTPLPGEGWSSPVIAGDRAWMTTATDGGRALWALAVDLQDGALAVERQVFTIDDPEPKNALNSYASPSPVTDGARVFLHFGTYGTACLDGDSGEVVWQRRDLHCDHMEGPGSSPALIAGRLVLHMDGGDVQYVVALDPATGETLWRRDRSVDFGSLPPDLRKAYSTPLGITVGDELRVISSGARATVAYDPETGEELWKVQHPGFSMSSRPITGDGLLFLNTGFMRPELWAVRPEGQGDVTEANVVWRARRSVPTMPSPVFVDGRIFQVSDSGIASCVDAETGERLWYQRLGAPHCASLLAAPGRVYYFDRDGGAVVIEPADEYVELARNTLDAGCMASPAVHDSALLVRTKTHLYRIEEE